MSVRLTPEEATESPSGMRVVSRASWLYFKQSSGVGRFILCLIGGAVAAGVLGYIIGSPGQNRGGTLFFNMLCLGLPLGFVAFLALAMLWYQKFASLMDLPMIEVNTDRLRLGDTLTLNYTQHFKQDTEIEAIQIQLICQEWVRYTEGTSTYTDTRNIVISEDWREAVPVTAAADYQETFTLQVPVDAMHTWTEATDNKIRWKLGITLDMPGEFDYKNDYSVTMLPEASNA